MNTLLQGDCRDFAADIKFDAVITDPPYDAQRKEIDWLFELSLRCEVNLIVFCKPENQFFHADEYLFWMKTPSTKNYTKACGRFVEMILVKRYGKTFNRLHWSQMTGVYDDRLIYPPVHPFQKPVSLMERLVRIYTNPGDVVLDPFMGSGTTGVACANTGRGFVGVEIDKEVFDIAQKNIEEVLK